jgi:hypothetical protein
MLPLAADESLHGDIVRGLRRREPGLDLITVPEASLRSRTDPEVLQWAAEEGRILITQDESTMIGYAWDRVKAGQSMPGLLVRPKGTTIRQAIEGLLLLAHCGIGEDFENRVQFFPL